MSWKVECCECGKKETFNDAKSVAQEKWRILAWQLHHGGEPLVVCPDCEYGKPRKKDK